MYNLLNYVSGMVKSQLSLFSHCVSPLKGTVPDTLETQDESGLFSFLAQSGDTDGYLELPNIKTCVDTPALNGRGSARCSNRLLRRNRFLPTDLASSRRNLHLISERMFLLPMQLKYQPYSRS